MRFVKFMNKHKVITVISAIIISILPIIFVHTLFKFNAPYKWLEAEWGAGDLLNYFGAIMGASATIVAIVLTIAFTNKNQKNERKLSIKPCFNTTYIPMFSSNYTFLKETQIVYVTYPLNDENETIGSSHELPYILEKVKMDKVEGILDSPSFYRDNYIMHYTISNVGAGNAINIKFTINEKQFMQPFSLVTNNNKEFLIILKAKLLNDGSRFIRLNFEYDDVASIGKYEQHECIELYSENGESLNIKQNMKDILSMSKDIS